MSNRFYVWFFLFCYALASLGVGVASNPLHIAFFFWVVLTPVMFSVAVASWLGR